MNRVPAIPPHWQELGRTTLGAAGDNITVSSFTAKPYLMVLTYGIDADQMGFRANSDIGNNYHVRRSTNGGADSTLQSTKAQVHAQGAKKEFNVTNWVNTANEEKLFTSHTISQNTAGAGNAPQRNEIVGKWANTSNQITTLTMHNAGATGFSSGSEVVVLGYDPADTSGTNFWEELASVELGSSNAEISSGTITAKKYLWVQIKQKGTANNVGNISLRFNNDTATNYASRFSTNGGADNTSQVSKTSLYMHDDAGDDTKGSLHNIFMINKADKEKLIISQTVQNTATGAGTAPARSEEVGKWANTANQITEIDVFGLGGGSFAAGSTLKVWGAD